MCLNSVVILNTSKDEHIRYLLNLATTLSRHATTWITYLGFPRKAA